jgi:hypothetical protein
MLSKLVFADKAKEKEWENADPRVKKTVKYQLKKFADQMETKSTVEMLVCVLNDLIEAVDAQQKEIDSLKKLMEV